MVVGTFLSIHKTNSRGKIENNNMAMQRGIQRLIAIKITTIDTEKVGYVAYG